jgi:hypothetical protein
LSRALIRREDGGIIRAAVEIVSAADDSAAAEREGVPMSPHIYSAMIQAQAAELELKAQRNRQAPRRARLAKQTSRPRRRAFGLLRLPSHA